MKTLFRILFILPLAGLLTACPTGLDFAPGKTGTHKINKSLTGTWSLAEGDGEFLRVTVEPNDEYSHKVHVLEHGTSYALETDDFIMYETEIADVKILYLKPDNEEKYYLYQYKIDIDGGLILADVPLLDKGVEGLISTESLRLEIEVSSKKPDFLTDQRIYYKDL
jgi:hypothetical protein